MYIVVCLAERHEPVHPAGKLTMWTLCFFPAIGSWTTKLPRFKNPLSIVSEIAGYDIWRQNLAFYEISTNKTYKWQIGDRLKYVSRLQMHAPGRTMISWQIDTCVHIVLVGTQRLYLSTQRLYSEVYFCACGSVKALIVYHVERSAGTDYYHILNCQFHVMCFFFYDVFLSHVLKSGKVVNYLQKIMFN